MSILLDLLLSIIGILLTIFIVVGVHEGAHFVVARMLGIKVLRCSIGFGKALYTWHDKHGTEYVIAPFPLGGYVKLLDESEGPVSDYEKHLAFNSQSLAKRFAVVAAGPFSNLVMAVLLYWIIFIVGFQTPLPIIGSVDHHSIASQAGLQGMEEIVSVDDHPTPTWAAVSLRLIAHAGDEDQTKFEVRHFKIPSVMTASSSVRSTSSSVIPASSSVIPASSSVIPASSSVIPAEAGIPQTSPPKNHILSLLHWQMNDLKPDPLSSLGITPYQPEVPLVIGIIKEGSPASATGLRIGDKILAINGKPIKDWEQLLVTLEKKPDQELSFMIERNKHKMQLLVKLGYKRDLLFRKHGFLGISPDFVMPDYLMHKIQYGPLEAGKRAFNEVVQLSYINLLLFGKLVTHKLSLYSLGGPITIFETAGSAFQYGLLAFLGFLAFLNVALGVINFFPIPGLDGGHLLFQFIEALIQRPLSIQIQNFLYRLGFIFLVLLIVQALTNDVLRMWS